jgi:uncharacterized protein
MSNLNSLARGGAEGFQQRPWSMALAQRCRRSHGLARGALLIGGGLLVGGANAASPSFNCLQATAPAARTICASAQLSLLDQQLTFLWQRFAQSFTTPAEAQFLANEQRRWILARAACQFDVDCLLKHYQARLDLLSGRSRQFPAAGIYGADQGRVFAAYPQPKGYLVAIRGLSSGTQALRCEIAGRAILEGSVLTVTAYHLSFTARLGKSQKLIVAPADRVSVVEEASCGESGRIDAIYTRFEP